MSTDGEESTIPETTTGEGDSTADKVGTEETTSPEPQKAKDDEITDLRRGLIDQLQKLRGGSRVVTYVSNNAISAFHAIQLYDLLRPIGKVDKLDLLIHSPGGDPDAAYKLLLLLREHIRPGGRLGVIVPFMSKSAATLLSLGADEIVMGPISELGPIDPQVEHPQREGLIPAQSIRDFMDFCYTFLSGCKNPEIGAALVIPLLEKLDPLLVGSYERFSKTSLQYATILLKKGMLAGDEAQAETTANSLTHGYMSHGYVIDRTEAKESLKLNISFAEDALWDCIWNLFMISFTSMYRVNANTLMETTDQTELAPPRQ